jgi:diguanylate cyclase (GGDEF)-like protein
MFRRKFHLRTLMLALSVGGILLTSMLLLGALTLFQKGNIEDSLLQSNLAYARKLADTTDRYLMTAQRELAWSASTIENLNDVNQLKQEANRLRLQSGFFNSVVIVSASAVITAASPESLGLIGVKLQSQASEQSISAKKAFISEPFTSAAGNYVVLVSQPIITRSGKYLGYIGGTIYLKKEGILSEILSMHFYNNKTDVSIVTDRGKIIFNQDTAQVSKDFKPGATLKDKLATTLNGYFYDGDTQSGALVGYASMSRANWKIIISGAPDSVSRILLQTVINAFWFTLAIIALTATTVTFFSARISFPLERLVEFAREEDSEVTLKKLSKINAWYNEADRLREAVMIHLQMMTRRVNKLSNETMTDPLTGLYNRKGFDVLVKRYPATDEHCIVAIDIDHFKKINDQHGHHAGDAVLVALSHRLKSQCVDDEIVCRFGGEEFVVFLPNTRLDDAAILAERIRAYIDEEDFPWTGNVTVSLGVASVRENGCDINLAFQQADEALYEAKRAGRNRVVVSQAKAQQSLSPS